MTKLECVICQNCLRIEERESNIVAIQHSTLRKLLEIQFQTMIIV